MNQILDSEARAAALGPGGKMELRLWLRLLTCTSLVESVVRTRLRTRYGATLPRFDLMAQLEKAPDGLTLGTLSRQMMVSNGNITGLVERLVADGLVERLPHPSDRRATTVRLTAEGHDHFARMAWDHERWIAQAFAGLDVGEIDTLMQDLARLKLSVRQMEERE